MRYWISLVLVILLYKTSLAQYPARINQIFLNPFAYNPAYIGDQGYITASLSYRKQWAGIEGAPATSWFTLQVPTDHRLALGINLLDDRYGAVATTSALATLGYGVSFSQTSYLRFGVSAGVGMHYTDLARIDDPDDPLVNTASHRRTYLDGNAGVYYRHRNLNLGVALPRLFEHPLVSQTQQTEVRLSRFKHVIAQAGYKVELPMSRWYLYPQMLYHINYHIGQAEGLLSASYHDRVWVSASYRQSSIWAGMVGFRLYQHAKLAYTYELPSVNLPLGATHELTLHWRFGQKRKINELQSKADKKLERNVQQYLNQSPKPIARKEEATAEPPEPSPPTSTPPERIEHAPASDLTNGMAAGNYVVVGTFAQEENALDWQKKLREQGYTPQYGYLPAKNYYYVYLDTPADLDSALQQAKKIRTNTQMKDAWILVVE